MRLMKKVLFVTPIIIGFLGASASRSDTIADKGIECFLGIYSGKAYSQLFWFNGKGKVEIYYNDTFDKDKDGDTFDIVKSADPVSYELTEKYIFVNYHSHTGEIFSKDKIDRYSLILTNTMDGSQKCWGDNKLFSNRKTFQKRIDEITDNNRPPKKQRKI